MKKERKLKKKKKVKANVHIVRKKTNVYLKISKNMGERKKKEKADVHIVRKNPTCI